MAAAIASKLDILKANEGLLDAETRVLVSALLDAGQEHLFSGWPEPGKDDDNKRRLLAQLRQLDSSYAGGLLKYISNAKKLLKDSKEGSNPFEGCVPSVPEGEKLDSGSDAFIELENAGLAAAGDTAFVLVAGGLGERLGYSGIKLALPVESATGGCYLKLYIESILALQALNGNRRQLPLAIMTSDDTHARTEALLRSHAFFGADPAQVTLVKQEKVACLADNDARLALTPGDAWAVQTKPHGHGDVHMLLHSSGLAARWRDAGLRWAVFFQDTNALVFRAIPAALGVSAARAFDFNSLAVPRRAKEAIGAITKLAYPDGTSRTLNVEYNQLDPLLRAAYDPEGDTNDDTGFSPFPGNINQLIVSLDSYCEELQKKGGVIGEFVNPKYADAGRTSFKSSTRLECMMQDFPKDLPSTARVGYTSINQVWAAYSPVKNSPADAAAKAAGGNPSHSATTGELDYYKANCKMLEHVGACIAGPSSASFNGLEDLDFWPRVVWPPAWAIGFDQLKARLPKPSAISLGQDTVLIVSEPNTSLESLTLERGAVEVAGQGPIVAGTVSNDGWTWEPLDEDKGAPEEEVIRGFHVVRHAIETLK
ncbi:USP2 [Auxenochlorella protothecoides x Auxenochlorella symbiontica]